MYRSPLSAAAGGRRVEPNLVYAATIESRQLVNVSDRHSRQTCEATCTAYSPRPAIDPFRGASGSSENVIVCVRDKERR